MGILAAAAVAWISTFFLIRLLTPISINAGLVDEPGGRKTHRDPVPLIGGPCILLGIQLGVLVLPVPLGEFRGLFAGAMIMLVIGFVDDFRELPAPARLIAQVGTILLAVALGGPVLTGFGQLLGSFELALGWLALPLTVFCAVGVINAFNMIDGADGISGTIFVVAAGAVLCLALVAGDPKATGLMAVLIGAVGGFLVLNARWLLPRARVFLGDAGTYTLGFVAAWVLIAYSQGPGRLFEPATALWLFAVPLLDTVHVMIRRMVQGQSPFAAGRDHLHHLFLGAGYSVRATWLSMAFLSGLLACLGLLMELTAAPQPLRFYGFLALSAAYYHFITRAWQSGSWLGRSVAGN